MAKKKRGHSVGNVSTETVARWAKKTPLSAIDLLLPARLPSNDRELLLQKVAAHRAGHHVALTVAELRALERARLNEFAGLAKGRCRS